MNDRETFALTEVGEDPHDVRIGVPLHGRALETPSDRHAMGFMMDRGDQPLVEPEELGVFPLGLRFGVGDVGHPALAKRFNLMIHLTHPARIEQLTVTPAPPDGPTVGQTAPAHRIAGSWRFNRMDEIA